MASGVEISAILRLARECEAEGVRTVLARLVSVEGSHYRKAGARMLLAEDGRSAGAISAGCLEADLRRQVPEVLSREQTRSIDYDSRSFEDLAWGLGTGCNGAVRVLLSPFTGPLRQTLERVSEILASGGTACVATAVGGPPGSEPRLGDVRLVGRLGEIPGERLSDFFVEEIPPPISLLIAGAAPDAVPLARLAIGLGWIVTILSSRDPRHVQARFAGLPVEFGGVDSAKTFPAHSRSAAIVMSHSFADDTAALECLLARGFPYLGVLGPRERTARLLEACGAPGETARNLHSPAGIDLGAETAEEIALSIVAEIQAALSKAAARPAVGTT
jgi:xanthine/CO dehydrogenase XdhC/CoxF family maturation factor